MTPAQIAAVARRAGFAQGHGYRGDSLTWAVAVALAESGGDPSARGDVTIQTAKWGPSIGLWQVRSLKPASLHLEPHRDGVALLDPSYNARSAFTISRGGQSFAAWSVLASGAAAAKLPAARMGVAQLNGAGAGSGATPGIDLPDLPGVDLPDVEDVVDAVVPDELEAVGSALSTIADAVRRVASWTSNPHNWARVAMVAGGMALLAYAVMQTRTGSAAVSAVATRGMSLTASAPAAAPAAAPPVAASSSAPSAPAGGASPRGRRRR